MAVLHLWSEVYRLPRLSYCRISDLPLLVCCLGPSSISSRPHVTYRQSVRHDRSLIGYPLAGARSVVGDALADRTSRWSTTVSIWRFVGWLGGLTWVLDEARAMILQSNPQFHCAIAWMAASTRTKRAAPERLSHAGNGSATLAGHPRVGGLFRLQFLPPVRHKGRLRLTYLGTP